MSSCRCNVLSSPSLYTHTGGKIYSGLRTHLETVYQQVRDHLGLHQRHQKALYDRATHGEPFKVGALVWLHCPAVPKGKLPKLHCYWQGLYRVVKFLGNVLFLVHYSDSSRKLFVFDRFKPHAHAALPQS